MEARLVVDNERILLVEDESKIARVITLELEYEGYKVDTAETGTVGFEKFTNGQWDLVLLDVMLPGLSGTEVLRRIRASGDMTPVILLTARDSIPDKVSGLDLGANDYITKPFQIEELLARIRACLRTSKMIKKETNGQALTVADLHLNEKTRIVTRSSVDIELTPREFDLLLYLMQHQNQVLNREQILTNVWGFDYYGDTNVVDVYIRYLRKKIDHSFAIPLIHTVRGIGYVLKE
ncbi:response regulator transcription factor [Aneurinibacillus migulanus]|uniref:PhoB family transcriptional regulator n=1 Tax=Aneurinibacillus migulanus TaxID=47500 RepID=A0A0D1WFF1_ANEMI|nr:response regulator transcription factor [Aneurinibacillus migulanus]KIV57260.1 PhoB family transcriptional regulator [Aneurinibacillus migulanus]KON96845.1 PhoB family transcriptional regulator [Aneurinibacillus migulanus]MED0895207.1 response regulator transcription factor [Aneurinibacillus migulanus]MED1619473.1 response regulator transcription factor [Aneurinibacillus migulanus]GED14130.1 putative transcriptional regulatory protein YkoG [Aneurinibacillus migulanus]